ncbi:polysaccharide biosynthesis protein [Parasphingorhabdus flavimaris]|uniref:Polysaccharide biosynthesis protein n=1 Tax=Parasphingorhabdus flavimaris TaxID=266812 RepID=A0ABX2MZP3_9SPHN|nr:nucleoside-diphosphate sugar epimerase/dehydratase [Parasphingorhabdus flavimaris]NVD26926.1 polysaccharide biosynthesis protein [Parasphingorhabdus flavimaris]|tara:strand:+ start:20507 stop:22429 length:1923 start_codon:yes stop_codon:yes gene_type:complete
MIENITAVVTSFLEYIARLARWKKKLIVFLLDILLCVQSIWIAYSLRIGVWILWDIAVQKIVLACLLIMVPVFVLTGVYQAIFRYAGTGMMKILVRAFAAYSVLIALLFAVIGVDGVPRTIGVIQPVIFFILVGFMRVAARYLMIDILGRNRFAGEVKNVLIYGAGSAGQQLAASMRSEPAMRLCGYVDDDKRLNGQRLDGDKVFWSGDLPGLIEKKKVTDILLALPRINRKKRRDIVEQIREFKVHVQTLPKMQEIFSGSVSFSDIRELEIEDLLGREPVVPNELLFGRTIVGKTVLVTGAGGSIGGELCRQIAVSGARRLILLDLSEYSLYRIEKELQELAAARDGESLELIPILGSVVDAVRVREIFSRWTPDTVFHAAAYKHVPLVEANPVEGIRNNILGTQTLAAEAEAAAVKDFILISTDKAVRPTNVMGASKRAAEQVIQNFAAKESQTKFSMVRFGNVLGSSGSVVPLFRQQIEQGGPITLTDRNVTRYFMTIPEAAQLVIQAAGMAKGGEVFVLDMGKSVRILDLAETMVRLSGLTVRDEKNPEGDIEIVEVGLRAGEKLYEELIIGNDPQPTLHARIMKAHESFIALDALNGLIASLMDCRDPEAAVNMLQSLVPEFEHGRDNATMEKAS